jgi:hypothetical protein
VFQPTWDMRHCRSTRLGRPTNLPSRSAPSAGEWRGWSHEEVQENESEGNRDSRMVQGQPPLLSPPYLRRGLRGGEKRFPSRSAAPAAGQMQRELIARPGRTECSTYTPSTTLVSSSVNPNKWRSRSLEIRIHDSSSSRFRCEDTK